MTRKRSRSIALFGTLALASALTGFLAACEKKDGPAEEFGEKIDDAAKKVGEKMEEAGEDMKDAAH
jgi:hypothetical protein